MWRSAVQLCQSLQGRPTRPAFFFWGYSSAGRAHALQAWGRRFESDYLHPMRLTLSSRPLFLFSRPAPSPLSVSCRPPFTLGALSPAGQGGTGDPRLPCRTRPSLRRHPLAGGGMSPHAAPSRPFALAIHQIGLFGGRTATLPLPSTKSAIFVDELPFCPCHPPNRRFWWTNRPFALGPQRHLPAC